MFIITGGAAGLLFDLFRVLRRVIPHSALWVQLEDALYWALVLLTVLYVLLNRAGGELRVYMLLGFSIGMVLYFSVCSRVIVRVLVWLAELVKRFAGLVLYGLLWPFRLLRRVFYIPIRECRNMLKKCAFSVKKGLHKVKFYVRIKWVSFTRELRVVFRKI